jgi:hypothetical protein
MNADQLVEAVVADHSLPRGHPVVVRCLRFKEMREACLAQYDFRQAFEGRGKNQAAVLGSTSRLTALPSRSSATSNSQEACMFIQNLEVVPK